MSPFLERLDYRAMGVTNIWVVDPMRGKAYDCSEGGCVEKPVIAGSNFEIPLDPLWKTLEELHS